MTYLEALFYVFGAAVLGFILGLYMGDDELTYLRIKDGDIVGIEP